MAQRPCQWELRQQLEKHPPRDSRNEAHTRKDDEHRGAKGELKGQPHDGAAATYRSGSRQAHDERADQRGSPVEANEKANDGARQTEIGSSPGRGHRA